MYKFIKPFLDNKMSIFEEYGAFNWQTVNACMGLIQAFAVCTWCKEPVFVMMLSYLLHLKTSMCYKSDNNINHRVKAIILFIKSVHSWERLNL